VPLKNFSITIAWGEKGEINLVGGKKKQSGGGKEGYLQGNLSKGMTLRIALWTGNCWSCGRETKKTGRS